MAITQADIDALEKAMVSGALRVRYPDGSEVQYRTMAEMSEALARARAILTPASATTPRVLVVRG
jgi:hypothetical protein